MMAPDDAADRAATVRDGLAIYQFGAGEPVFFMPGPHRFQRPGLRTADALIAGLVALGRSVITFDPPGSGRSTRPARVSMAEMHGCADEAFDACQVRGPIDALGHSMGGLAALGYALERHERVRRLVLVGTGTGGRAYMNAPGALWNRSHPRFWRMAVLGLLQMAWPRRAPERLLLNLVERESFVDRRLARPGHIAPSDWFRGRVGRTDWRRVAGGIDFGPRLAEIRIPTLVLCGRRDPQYPPACSLELAAGIDRARLVWFERSGHYPFIEEADRFQEVVGEFLGDAGSGSQPRPVPG